MDYEQIKATYIAAAILILLFIGFIVFVVVLYNRKQLLFLKEKQLLEAEQKNLLLQTELEKQKSIETERERISHDMHDDLGAGISAIKLQTEFLLKKIKDEQLQNELSGLLKTSEEMNISMREMLWSLNSKNDMVGNLIQFISNYAEQFFEKTDMKIQLKKDNISPETIIGAQRRRNLFLCSKEAFNNIYKHSKAENVIVSFSQNSTDFIMKIQDDGIGIPNEKTNGNGLRNMKIRMEKLGGEFLINATSKETVLEFRIPFLPKIQRL